MSVMPNKALRPTALPSIRYRQMRGSLGYGSDGALSGG